MGRGIVKGREGVIGLLVDLLLFPYFKQLVAVKSGSYI